MDPFSKTTELKSSDQPPLDASDNRGITELQRKSELLQKIIKQERVLHQALLDSLGEGLIVIDRDGIITTVNPSCCAILGYDSEELIGRWFTKAIKSVTPAGVPIDPLQRMVIQALSLGKAISGNSFYIRSDGDMIPVSINVAPVIINDKPVGAIEIFRDITQELALDKAKDEFVSLTSHQLRTPATAVKAILSMMLGGDFGDLNDRQQHYLQKALETNDRQLHIIEDLLNTARVDAGQLSLSIESLDLATLAHDAVQEHLASLRERNLNITLEKPVESTVVKADPEKLRMVIDNLLSNASKYTPDGGRISVHISSKHADAVLSIRDTGIGIAQEDMDKLFRKFSRIDNELSGKVDGNGLGLYLVKHIIDLHEGSVEVSSRPGYGSTFTFILPLADDTIRQRLLDR